jgi:hypothetical protein
VTGESSGLGNPSPLFFYALILLCISIGKCEFFTFSTAPADGLPISRLEFALKIGFFNNP